MSMIIEKISEKNNFKSFFDHNLRFIFEIFEKKKCEFMSILDMKVSNTDIIDTVTDEKKLNLCLIQGWCFQKSLSTVPKRAKIMRLNVNILLNTLRAHDVTLNLVKFVYFSVLVLDRNITIPTFDFCESLF